MSGIIIPMIFGTSLYKLTKIPFYLFTGGLGGIIGYIIGYESGNPKPSLLEELASNGLVGSKYREKCPLCEGEKFVWKELWPHDRKEEGIRTGLEKFKEDAEMMLDKIGEESDMFDLPNEFYDKLNELQDIIDGVKGTPKQ